MGPPQPPEPDEELLCGGEGLIRPPLPCLFGKMIAAEEEIFFSRREPNQSAKKINFVEEFKNMSNLIERLAQTDNRTKPYLSKSRDPCL